MRVGFVADNFPERLLLATGILPELAIMPFFSTVVGNAVITAQRKGLFDLLKKPRTVVEVAVIAETDPHGTQVLLESLSAFGYLERTNGRFQISRQFTRAHPTPAIQGWMKAAGFDSVRKLKTQNAAHLVGRNPLMPEINEQARQKTEMI
jgi:hypothetical protein